VPNPTDSVRHWLLSAGWFVLKISTRGGGEQSCGAGALQAC